ncbi:MAG: hypothetical protein ACKVPX_16325 [Myxococcaceae bacterium]
MTQWLRPEQLNPNPWREGPSREVRDRLRAIQRVRVPKPGDAPAPSPAEVRAIAKQRLAELKYLGERNRALAATNGDSVWKQFGEWRTHTLEQLKGSGDQLKVHLECLPVDGKDPGRLQEVIQLCEEYLRGLAYPWLPGRLADLFVSPLPIAE